MSSLKSVGHAFNPSIHEVDMEGVKACLGYTVRLYRKNKQMNHTICPQSHITKGWLWKIRFSKASPVGYRIEAGKDM